MKARITKLVSLFAMTAMFLFSNIAAQVTSAIGVECDNAYSIESCADNIRDIYKDKYPESAAMIDDIVDTIVSDDMFVSIFEEEGASAFQIVEDSLRDALDSEPTPLMQTDDLYTSKYSFPMVKQMNTYFCGPASTLMALIGSGASSYYYTNDTTTLNNWQISLAKEDILNATPQHTKTDIERITKVLNDNIPSKYGYKYKSKAFTIHSYSKALDFVSTSLVNDAVPVLLIRDTSLLKYYKGASFSHYVVINYVDFNAETVMIKDPHYDSRYHGIHVISFDEFEYLAKYSEDLWMSVYTDASSDHPFIYS